MSRVNCEKVEVIESSSIPTADLRTTLNTLCDQIENGRIANMDMTIITMGLEPSEISVSTIQASAQIHPTDVLPTRITATSVQALGVDRDQLFDAYTTLCDTVQPFIVAVDHTPESKIALLRMGVSDCEIAMVPGGSVIAEDEETNEEEDEDEF